jgi:hypothetical protein
MPSNLMEAAFLEFCGIYFYPQTHYQVQAAGYHKYNGDQGPFALDCDRDLEKQCSPDIEQ